MDTLYVIPPSYTPKALAAESSPESKLIQPKVAEELTRRFRDIEDAQLPLINLLHSRADGSLPKKYAQDIVPLGVEGIGGLQSYAQDLPATRSMKQGYIVDESGGGIDLAAFRSVLGGRGEKCRVVVIETGWHGAHADLPRIPAPPPSVGNSLCEHRDHTVNVLGVMAAQRNGHGIDGIADLASFEVMSYGAISQAKSIYRLNIFNTIAEAILRFDEQGGVMVVAFDAFKVQGDFNTSHLGLEAWWAARALFILADLAGIIPVIAAGNGHEARIEDHLEPGGRAFYPSPAIVVGGGRSFENSPCGTSNRGGRVDLHCWGENVTTLKGQDSYTGNFGGTSAATAIVAGVVAAVRSHLSAVLDEKPNKTRLKRMPNSRQVRDLLVRSGFWHNREIGSRPHFGRLLAELKRVDYDFDLLSEDRAVNGSRS